MNFKRMKTLLLELAIHGKLVPQMTEEGQVKSSIDGPFELPKTWGWRKFEDVLFFENGDRGSNYPAKSTLTRDPSSGHPFVSAINLNNGRICPDDLLYLSVEQKQKLRSGHIKAGDCLFCIRGSLGKFGFAEADGGAIASSLVILRKKDAATIREEFLAYVLQSPFFAQCIEDRSNGTAQPNLGAKELKGFPFPVPPLQEQARIVAKLEEAFAEIDRAEKAYEELQTLAGVLRGQILQEAIQGKLVPQLAEEGVVEQIGEVTSRIPFTIPEKWKWVQLKSVGQIVGGGTPKTSVADYWGDEISWVTPADLGKNSSKWIHSGAKSITRKGLDESSAKLMPEGSVVYSSRAPIGHIAIAGQELCTNQGCKSFVPNTDLITTEWAYYTLIARTKDIQSRASGTTFKEISGKGMGETWIALPPLGEQQRIVTKIEDLLNHVDALTA